MTLKLSTTPELRPQALRALDELRAAGLAVEAVTPTVRNGGRRSDMLSNSARSREVDLAVVPLHQVREPGRIAAVLERGDPLDVLLARGRGAPTLRGLPPGMQVGVAGALRRALLRAHRPDLEPLPLENGQSPSEAFAAGRVDAAVVGADEARQARLDVHVRQALDPKAWLPAPQQAAVAVVAGLGALPGVRAALDHAPTRAAVTCEGALAARMGAGHAALGALALPSGPTIRLWAMLVSADGGRVVRGDLTGRVSEPEALAERMAEHLTARGAEALLGP